mgnify:CR=1 FL=1
MTYELLEIETRILRDEEFIQIQSEDHFSDLEDLSDFRSLGDVIKQMSFDFHDVATFMIVHHVSTYLFRIIQLQIETANNQAG